MRRVASWPAPSDELFSGWGVPTTSTSTPTRLSGYEATAWVAYHRRRRYANLDRRLASRSHVMDTSE
jgi:hypothetical protein